MLPSNSHSIVAVTPDEYQIRDIPGFPGYRIDTLGQLWSNRYKYSGRIPYDPTTPYRLLKFSARAGHHTEAALQRNGRRVKVWVHRLVLETFVGPSPPGMECRHLDGEASNNKLNNLVWGTRAENWHDRKRHGTDNSGARHYRASLTEDQVREIRQRYAAGDVSQADLGKLYSVTPRVVSKIVNGVTYASVGGPLTIRTVRNRIGK